MTRKCRECNAKFTPIRPMQPTCENFACKLAYANRAAEKSAARRKKDEAAKAKAERRAVKAAKEKLKTKRDYTKGAQIAFNAYIRERDKEKPCICCGEPLLLDSVGGGFDCGHYRSVGSAPHLRFDERNAHGQRKKCNRYGAGRAVDYRLGLIVRIGAESVAEIEADQADRKWTIDDLKRIRDEYREKLKALRRLTENM